MQYIAMSAPGSPEVLELKTGPRPSPGPGDVLIQVAASGVNRPDLAQRAGTYPPPPGASPILGLEVAGTIVEAPGSSEFKSGDRVCALVPGGGYSEYCITPAAHCLKMPSGLDFIHAAGIPEAFFTVWANVFQIGGLTKGQRFLVHGGSSGIGTTAIQLAAAFGAEVYTTAGSTSKTAACLQLGAHFAINYRTEDFVARIAELTHGQGLNLILDMVGGDYTQRNLNCLSMNGRLVQIATQGGAKAQVHLPTLMQKRLVITGSTLRPRAIADKALIAAELKANVWPLLESGHVKVIVDRVFSLDQARQAHEYLEAGTHIGKVILRQTR